MAYNRDYSMCFCCCPFLSFLIALHPNIVASHRFVERGKKIFVAKITNEKALEQQ